jgi:hypothetical protein
MHPPRSIFSGSTLSIAAASIDPRPASVGYFDPRLSSLIMPAKKSATKDEKAPQLSYEQIRARRTEERQDERVAWQEYLSAQEDIREKTSRLRAERLERERRKKK